MKRIPALLAVALVSACASAPTHSTPELDEVRATYRAVSDVPEIRANAAYFLHQADAAIARADNTLDTAEYDHQIYMARRYLEMAQAATKRELSEREVEQLTEQHNQLRRELRTEQEAENARRSKVLETELAAMEATRVERGIMVTLHDLLFTPGRADLSPSARDELRSVSNFLRNHPDRVLVVEGHTDGLANTNYNRMLSKGRAYAVKQALVAQGIDPDRIISRGYGEARPIANNRTESGRQLNRRVDLVILAEGTAPPEPGETN
ncbi:OmpA family protein [Thiohalomonas denitrificans]|uniref:Outer membrane protein OmpA n=1 Tax=Thiohalomonas denitrificans TaxID=415747 RepID=A0A1G5PV13_9GAMM|nr:OmpA family protein [Thiohalomonas denitrificans]SCZ53257.1 Outer membrane protein OmpA [Thiohalomonas denitrificans]